MFTHDAFSFALIIFGLAGFAGGAVGYFSKGRADAVIALQAQENKVLSDANTRLEKENVAKDATIVQQKQQIETLTGLAQGSPQLIKLTNEIKGLVGWLKQNGSKK